MTELVYIKRIDLRGFKTFGRKATLRLGRGLTVITGPNGSGKSNILDSLRFALGELSPKELRGSSLSDLISKSTVPNPPRSAHVAVQFDNADRRLPMDSDSLTISREFHKGGEGIYRLNGRRVSRKQLTELLSSADIHVAGYNIVPQHAVTRLAEVTSEERRKIIEDLIGLGIYDLRKAESQAQLNLAETNIRIASARVDEVRLRVESLEKERNDFLRHSLLTKEITRLQAQTISSKLAVLKKEIEAIKEQAELKESRLKNLRSDRDKLSTSRLQLEQDMRSLQERLLDSGGQKIHELQRYLTEVNSEIGGLKANIEAKKLNLQILKKQTEDLEQETSQHASELDSAEAELLRLRDERHELEGLLEEREVNFLQLSKQLQEFRGGLTETSKNLENVEGELELATKEFIKINSQIEAESTRLTMVQNQLKTLQERGSELRTSLGAMQKRLEELGKLRAHQEERLSQLDRIMSQHLSMKEGRRREVDEVSETAETADESILEFKARKKALEVLAPEETAISEIEELHSSGILHNIVGCFRDLVQFDKGYERAFHAACADWLNSLVVKDIAAAISCIECLKHRKLSRIKIIPLDMVASTPAVAEPPNIEGVTKRMIDCVRYDESLEAAVNFVLGDTIVTNSQRAAYLSSLKGFRAVVLTGDLYEPRGGLEGGYYREPLDIGSMAPRTESLHDLEKTVASLTNLIEKGKSSLERLDSEIEKLREERTEIQNTISTISRETEAVQDRIQLTNEEISRTDQTLVSLQDHTERDREKLQLFINRKSELEQTLRRLEDEKSTLRYAARSDKINETEKQHSILGEELNQLKRKKAIVDSRISSLETSIQSKAKVLERAKDQARYIQERGREVASSIESAEKELESWTFKLSEATLERENLLNSLESLKQGNVKVQSELNELNESIQKIEREIEPLSSNLTMLRLELNRKELEENYLFGELGRLGFEGPIETPPVDPKMVETHLSTLRNELQQIGAINELAVTHYEEQKNNYKQLSIRINQLEQEKQSILKFMEELEQKKRETFMSVFERLNHNFNEIFSKITDGGRGGLVLENPEEIFSGGVDMHLAFPGKAELSIGSASGGEKSVATVCFLLALQAIHPMPFYIFDEIDAHLDMVNSQRLADLLKERSTNSQFIVVSLKDTTISRADGVYGIFIQDGFSQVVSLPKPEARTDDRT